MPADKIPLRTLDDAVSLLDEWRRYAGKLEDLCCAYRTDRDEWRMLAEGWRVAYEAERTKDVPF